MKKQLLIIALGISTLLSAQTISFTSAELTTAEIGSTITVNYNYTIAADGYIYCAIELLDDWTWSANIASAELSNAVAGTNVTGSFNLTIPTGTTPTADLTGNLNYKIKIELKQNPSDWLAGVYPATQINLTTATAGVGDFESNSNELSVFPNPAKNSIQLNNLSNLNNTSIKIFNLIGKEVISASNTKSIIDISTLVNGIYILNIKSENKSIKIKFIKI